MNFALQQGGNQSNPRSVYPSSLKLPLGGQGVRPMSVDYYVIRRTPAANNAAASKAKGIQVVHDGVSASSQRRRNVKGEGY